MTRARAATRVRRSGVDGGGGGEGSGGEGWGGEGGGGGSAPDVGAREILAAVVAASAHRATSSKHGRRLGRGHGGRGDLRVTGEGTARSTTEFRGPVRKGER